MSKQQSTESSKKARAKQLRGIRRPFVLVVVVWFVILLAIAWQFRRDQIDTDASRVIAMREIPAFSNIAACDVAKSSTETKNVDQTTKPSEGSTLDPESKTPTPTPSTVPNSTLTPSPTPTPTPTPTMIPTCFPDKHATEMVGHIALEQIGKGTEIAEELLGPANELLPNTLVLPFVLEGLKDTVRPGDVVTIVVIGKTARTSDAQSSGSEVEGTGATPSNLRLDGAVVLSVDNTDETKVTILAALPPTQANLADLCILEGGESVRLIYTAPPPETPSDEIDDPISSPC